MARYRITGTVDIGYWLVLNNMRDRLESCTPFGPFDTPEEALQFHDSQKAETSYVEEGPDGFEPDAMRNFRKTFKKGGPLEWMNPLLDSERHQPSRFGHGVRRLMENLEINTQVKI